MNILFLDLETASRTPIKAGSYRYSEDARIIVQAYSVGDGEIVSEAFDGPKLQRLIDKAGIVVMHNGGLFDRVQLARHGVVLPAEKLHDTMAIAYQHSLPGSLATLGDIFRLETPKDADGKRLIRLFCIPNKKGVFATPESHPEDWQKFLSYARADIASMRELYRKMPTWNLTPFERRLWAADMAINDRGVAVDTDLARAALTAVEKAQKGLAERTDELTLGLVSTATQRDAMLKFINGVYDLGLEDLRGSTVEKALENADLPEELRELLAVRLQASTTSTAKYKALLQCASSDGRLRGTKQYCGAMRTGRWAGRLFQPDNLPRPAIGKLKDDELQEAIDLGIEALGADCADLVFDNVMELTSACIRGTIITRRDRPLAVADLSNIEGRVLAWLAGEHWKLSAFAAGKDLYKVTAGRILGKAPEDITKQERQEVGKVSELALGFGGGPGAFVTFATAFNIDIDKLADTARGTLDPEVVRGSGDAWEWMKREKRDTLGLRQETWIGIDAIKRAWRLAHPAIARFWHDLEEAAACAIKRPGDEFKAGRVTFVRNAAWLLMRLPSDRVLCYPSARADDGITYMGVNQYSRRFERIRTYGGKLSENATQAVARDILAHGLLAAEEAGFDPVMHVHDEILAENCTAEELARVMSTNPAWAEGLPLNAEGFETYRYRK
jgi:DNA polymerase